MDVGVPREKRDFEKRVGLTPTGCHVLFTHGHRVYVETGAGAGSGFSDRAYQEAGAEIVFSALEAYGRASMVLKVTPLLAQELPLLNDGQIVLCFHHLAVAEQRAIDALTDKKVTAIAYETIQRPDGTLPVLTPMSQVAGRMAPQIAARFLESPWGHGILLSGVPGVPAADVCILVGGVVGRHAARAFHGLGARVVVLDQDPERLEVVQERVGADITTMVANEHNLRKAVSFADVLVGAVLIPGARAPIVVTRTMVKTMRARSVVIDFSIDQGGCVETSRPTTPGDPVFIEEGIIHYCVPNVPGVVPRTSTHALTNVTLPFIEEMADQGLYPALRENGTLRAGVNLLEGRLVNPRVAESFGLEALEIGAMLQGGPQ